MLHPTMGVNQPSNHPKEVFLKGRKIMAITKQNIHLVSSHFFSLSSILEAKHIERYALITTLYIPIQILLKIQFYILFLINCTPTKENLTPSKKFRFKVLFKSGLGCHPDIYQDFLLSYLRPNFDKWK